MSSPPSSSACATSACGPPGVERSTDTARTASPDASGAEFTANVARAGDHARALGGQRLRDGETNALARTGHDGDLASRDSNP